MNTPIFAFITFTTQEARERFGKFNCKKRFSGNKNLDYEKYELLGEEADVRFCNEPSDILWENLEKSYFGRMSRRIISAIIIVIFLFFTTLIFYLLRAEAGSFA